MNEVVDSAEIRMLVSELVDRLLVVVVVILLVSVVAVVSESLSGRRCPLMAVAFVALEFEWRALNWRMFRLRNTGRRRAICRC